MPNLESLDLDWVEKLGWCLLLFGLAEVCGELAGSMRDQRKRARELDSAGAAAYRQAIAAGAARSAPLQLAAAPAAVDHPRRTLVVDLGSGLT